MRRGAYFLEVGNEAGSCVRCLLSAVQTNLTLNRDLSALECNSNM